MKNSLNLTSKKDWPLRQYAIILAVIPLSALVFITGSFAQSEMKWKGSGGWGTNTDYCRMYNLNTIDTIDGEVISVEKFTPEKGMAYGVHLIVKTRKEVISVHLGPGWFIENQDINIKTRDKIEVSGSRITYEAKPVIIASEIKTRHGTLLLRNKIGEPVWVGWRNNQDMSAK